jgi:pimeloyl-ACP methyl ester carboxylesterase
MEFDNVSVSGGELQIARFGTGPRLIIAIHGITASLMSWAAIARALPAEWSLVAMDLRGRGLSSGLPGPYGLPAHADDVARVADHVRADSSAVLTGHSMGAYVAVLLAAQRDFARTVLVDGGLPMPLASGADPDTVLDATLGPAMARLSQRYPTVNAYVDVFRVHPALAQHWTPEIEEYVRYDAVGSDGSVRSRASAEAVRQDGRWMLTESAQIAAALKQITTPLALLRAPRGLLDQPVGLIPDALAAAWAAKLPGLADELIADCNHYTIIFDPRCVRVVTDRLTQVR